MIAIVNMNVKFFLKDNKFDVDAIGKGVYIIELARRGQDVVIPLYIGESVWMAVRCAGHLYRVCHNPEYLGLKSEDIENSNFELIIRVLETIEDKGKLLQAEIKYIDELEPLTQKRNGESGRGKRDSMIIIDEKIKRVQDAIRQNFI